MKRLLTSAIALVMLISIADAAPKGHRPRHHRDVYYAADGLGVSFGYVHSAYRLSDWATDKSSISDGLDGFNLGLTKDFRIIDNVLYLQTGLMYTYQNDSRNEQEDGVRVVGDWNEHFLSIPVKVKYEVPVLPNLNVFVMGGPTLVEGLDSKMKYRATIGDENFAISYNCFNGKIKSNNDVLQSLVGDQFHDMKYRRFDVQLGASAGVRFYDIFEAQIGYDWGLINKFKGENAMDLMMRRQQFYISLGLRF